MIRSLFEPKTTSPSSKNTTTSSSSPPENKEHKTKATSSSAHSHQPDSTASTVAMSLPKTYKQAAFHEAGGSLVVSDVPLKEPAAGEILIKVEACGVCHSDVQPQHNAWGAGFPLVPGHEVIGTVAAVGEDVTDWKQGERIGAAWHGGMCNSCNMCKQGLYQFCAPYHVNGVTRNGGCRCPPSPISLA